MNLLIADDDKTFCELLAAEMREFGWKSTTASDAMQAIMFAVRSQPDAIVLDVKMPGGTGVQALKKLKASSKTNAIPVIVVSASSDPDVEHSLLQLGAARFLPKPVDAAVLHQELSDLLRAAADAKAQSSESRRHRG